MSENIINSDVQPPEKPDLKKDFYHYKRVLSFMGANVPLQVLCLPKPLEKLLIAHGFQRVYDLIDRDLTEIEGIGDRRLDLLTSRLDEFFSVSL